MVANGNFSSMTSRHSYRYAVVLAVGVIVDSFLNLRKASSAA